MPTKMASPLAGWVRGQKQTHGSSSGQERAIVGMGVMKAIMVVMVVVMMMMMKVMVVMKVMVMKVVVVMMVMVMKVMVMVVQSMGKK